MKKPTLIALTVALMTEAPLYAQMDWLTPTLENNTIWQHQRRKWKKGGKANQRRSSQRRAAKGRRKSSYRASTRKAPERYPQVQVNGRLLQSSIGAVQVNGHTFVPFRDILEALGATVTYNSQERLITARRGSSIAQLSLPGGSRANMKGKREYFVGGNSDQSPFIRKGVTMVPLRMVSEKMGAQVVYVQRSAVPLISITSKPA